MKHSSRDKRAQRHQVHAMKRMGFSDEEISWQFDDLLENKNDEPEAVNPNPWQVPRQPKE